MSNHWVFMYASTMDICALRYWFRHYTVEDTSPFSSFGLTAAVKARLKGFRRVFSYAREDGGGGATLIQDENASVEGVALCVSDEVLEALDVKEGAATFARDHNSEPMFQRVACQFELDEAVEKSVSGWTYIAQSRTSSKFVPPYHSYKHLLEAGAQLFCLSSTLEELDQIESVNPKIEEILPAQEEPSSNSIASPTVMYPRDMEAAEGPEFEKLENLVQQTKNGPFGDIASAYCANLQSAHELLLMPYRFFIHSETTLWCLRIEMLENFRALDYLTNTGTAIPAEERQASLNERLRNALGTSEVLEHIGKESHQKWVGKLDTDERMREFAYKLLSASISFAWTSVEILGRDLWIAAVNTCPTPFATAAGGDKTLTVSELSREQFNLRSKMGNLLANKYDFTNIRNIADSYDAILGAPFRSIKNALETDQPLFLIEKTRHLLQHKAGIVDEKFLKETKMDFAIGQRVPLSYQLASSGIQAAIDLGGRLIAFVDQIVSANQEPSES